MSTKTVSALPTANISPWFGSKLKEAVAAYGAARAELDSLESEWQRVARLQARLDLNQIQGAAAAKARAELQVAGECLTLDAARGRVALEIKARQLLADLQPQLEQEVVARESMHNKSLATMFDKRVAEIVSLAYAEEEAISLANRNPKLVAARQAADKEIRLARDLMASGGNIERIQDRQAWLRSHSK